MWPKLLLLSRTLFLFLWPPGLIRWPQVYLSCTASAAYCSQISFFLISDSCILLKLMATQSKHGPQSPLQPDVARPLNSSRCDIIRRASGKYSLKEGHTLLPLLFFLPASWNSDVMPGAWAAIFDPCQWKSCAETGRAIREKMPGFL